MIDSVGAEYAFAAPTGDWLADLLAIGDQARAIMRRHPWLPSLLITRSVLGPNGLVLLEHVLEALAPHPAGTAAKLEAFAMLNTVTALFVQTSSPAARPGSSATPPTCSTSWRPAATRGCWNCSPRQHRRATACPGGP